MDDLEDIHFIDVNGNHFVVPSAPKDYQRDDGSIPIPNPPSTSHRWIEGEWRIPDPDLTQAWAVLRIERDRRLLETDWTQLSDSPVDREEWADYRQALRDLPQNTEDPTNPEWPSPPESNENG